MEVFSLFSLFILFIMIRVLQLKQKTIVLYRINNLFASKPNLSQIDELEIINTNTLDVDDRFC